MEDFTGFVCYQLKSTMKKLEKNLSQKMDEFGITVAQSFILFSLLEKEGCTLSEIGNRAQIDNSSLTTMVDKLEREGLVERKLYAQDRRVITLFLTEAGRKLAERVFAFGFEFDHNITENLGGHKEDFIKTLALISKSLEK